MVSNAMRLRKFVVQMGKRRATSAAYLLDCGIRVCRSRSK
jgi:hypothetical protein